MSMLQGALKLASRGFKVFPLWWRNGNGRCACRMPGCDSPGKHPLISQGFHNASHNVGKIEQWWEKWPEANIGVATGKASGIIVLDIDEPVGLEECAAIKGMPRTYTVQTQSGGLHLYFEAPGDVEVRNRTRFRPGLDLRGDGGYVVAPPSGGYRVAINAPIAPFDWLNKLLRSSVYARIAKAKGPLQLPKIIKKGERHYYLFRLAARLRGAGKDAEEIYEELTKVNKERCRPREDEEVIERLVEDVCERYEVKGEIGANRYDEVGLVDRIRLELATPEADSIATRQEHWFYDEGVWVPLQDDGVTAFLHGWKDETYYNADGKPKMFRPTLSRIRQVSDHLRLVSTRHDWFEKPPACLGFRNGVLLPDGTLAEHSPAFRLQYKRPEDYDPDAEAPIWEAFLRQTFAGPDCEQKIAVLQEFAGLALFGKATEYEKALILVGPGANGKSVLLRVFEGMMPPGSVTAIAPHEMTQEYRRATLATSMLNVVAEVPARELLDTEAIKAIISGDQIEGRRIHQEEFTFHPRAAHLFAANALPQISDFSLGFRRKWVVLTTPNTVPENRRIPRLDGILLDRELSGIIRWAVEGMMRVEAQEGYSRCAASDHEVVSWLRAADPVADFVEECLIADNTVSTSESILFDKWTFWQSFGGRRRMTKRNFVARLRNYVKRESHGPHKEAVFLCRIRSMTR